jgi:hypothetical protein
MTTCPITHSNPHAIPHSTPLNNQPAQTIDLEWDNEHNAWLITGAFNELYRAQFAAAPENDKMLVKGLCDPHAEDHHTPEQVARTTDLSIEVIAGWLHAMGVPPAALFAFYRIGMILTPGTVKEFPRDSIEMWNRLVTAHHVATDLFFWTLENALENITEP